MTLIIQELCRLRRGVYRALLVIMVVDRSAKVTGLPSFHIDTPSLTLENSKYTGPRTKDLLQLVDGDDIEDGLPGLPSPEYRE